MTGQFQLCPDKSEAYRGGVNWLGNKGNIVLHRKRPSQDSLGQLPEVEAGVDGEDLGGEEAVVDGREAVRRSVLQPPVFSTEQEPAAHLSRGRDDWEEHSVQVEVPEVAGDLHPVVEEGDDGDGEVEGAADVVPLLHVWLVHCGNHQRVSSSSPQVCTFTNTFENTYI